CERYRHHDFDGGPSPPLRDRRWRKTAQVCGYRPHRRHRSRRFHGETVAGNSSEAVRDQPSRFTVRRLIVSPSAGKHALWCVGDCVLDSVSRPKEENKEDKGSLSTAGTKQRLPFLCCLWFEEVPTSPRNLVFLSVLYLSERPELTSHDEEPMKVRTTNLKRKKQQQ